MHSCMYACLHVSSHAASRSSAASPSCCSSCCFRGRALQSGSLQDLGMACGWKTRLHTLHWLTTGTKCTPLFAERIPFRLGVTFRLGAAAQSAVAWSPRRSTAACWIPISATWEHRAWYERSPDASNRPSDRDILKNFLLFFSHEARASWASYRVADGRTDRQTLRLTYTIDMGTVDVPPPRATEVRAIRSRLVMTDSQWRVDGPNRRCAHGGPWSVSVRPGPGCARPCVVFRSRFGSLAHWVSARRTAHRTGGGEEGADSDGE
mmetsp:Transcript_342/g.880  ORF Transcript_342/g.880 Transcript_342/m.880 type:complete len:264 (-) Transcript_342:176-967(-)